MKSVSDGFKARLRKGHTDLARIMTLNLANGTSFYYTDHDRDIFYSDVLYRSDPGITISAIADTVTDGFQDATIELALVAGGITEEMSRYGTLGGAIFYLERIFYDAVELGTCFDFAGSIRETVVNDKNKLELSVNGAGSLAGGVNIGELFSERCRNVFGDFRCKVDINALATPFAVIAAADVGNVFFASVVAAEDEAEVSKTITNKFVEPGDYQYIVPNREFLEIVLAGAGGGQGGGNSVAFKPGDPGGFSSFLGAIAYGGEPGLVAPPSNGSDTGGEGADSVVVGGGGKGGKQIGADPSGGGTVITTGGNGGLITKRYKIGQVGTTDGDVRVGDAINFVVGKGGRSGTEFFQNSGGFHGEDGYATITARGNKFAVDDAASFGTIFWLTGNNIGRISPITKIEGQIVTIDYNIGFPIQAGDTGLFRPGCNHYRSDCIKYNNINNYRGEPDVANYQPKPKGIDSKTPQPNTTSNLNMPFAG